MFKDLKQILRKEQCDASILLTANVPSTKKIIVHGPQGKLYRFILGLKQIGFTDFSDSLNYLLPTKVVTENSHICCRIYILHSRFSSLTKFTTQTNSTIINLLHLPYCSKPLSENSSLLDPSFQVVVVLSIYLVPNGSYPC